MTTGENYSHSDTLPLGKLESNQLLALAIETAKSLSWPLGKITATGFEAFPHFQGKPGYEIFTFQIANGIGSLYCTGDGLGNMSSGEINKANINLFIQQFHTLRESTDDEWINERSDYWMEVIRELKDGKQNSSGSDGSPLQTFIDMFVPEKQYFVTPILVILNVLIFVIMVLSGVDFFSPDTESLLRWGANNRMLTLDGQAWRLLSACFIHIGFLHLVMNMYALIFIGALLEPFLNRSYFLIAYLISGLMASTVSMAWHSNVAGAGASGAIFGMYGVFLALLSTNLVEKNSRKELLVSIGIFIGYNLLFGLKSGVDNAAHVGGLFTGFFIGRSYVPSLRKPAQGQLKTRTLALNIIVGLGIVFSVYYTLPNTYKVYDLKMKAFTENETRALQFYHLPDSASKEILLRTLNDSGIYYWNENLVLLDQISQLKLPGEYQSRNDLLQKYCRLRLNTYRLLYQQINEGHTQSVDSINWYYKAIDSLFSSMQQQP